MPFAIITDSTDHDYEQNTVYLSDSHSVVHFSAVSCANLYLPVAKFLLHSTYFEHWGLQKFIAL